MTLANVSQLLNRRPPYGHEILSNVQELPQYSLSIVEDDVTTYKGKQPVKINLTITCGVLDAIEKPRGSKNRARSLGKTSILSVTSEMDFVDFRRIS